MMWPFNRRKKEIEQTERPFSISKPETSKKVEIERMANRLQDVLLKTEQEVVILCVGSDRSTGDALGPFVGSMLVEKNIPFPVYGTLEEPVHALNLKNVIKEIHQQYTNPFILGVDACLGDEKNIGMVLLEEGPFIPGNAVHKNLPSIGNYHIKAIVNYLYPFAPIQSLNSTRLLTVKRLAEIIVEIIVRASTIEDKAESNK